MGKGKYLKKACLYFVLSMVLAASLAGCVGYRRKNKKINSSYSEWIDALGIKEYPHISSARYKEFENGVEFYIEEFDYESAEVFKKIIDNHNAFVKRNPDYFPEDFDIDLIFISCGGNVNLYFSNYTESVTLGKNHADYVDVSSIETEKSHRMRYVCSVRLNDRINTKFEVETIIVSIGKGIETAEKAHDWSEDFENFDTIVVEIIPEVECEINVEKALEKIQRANPDAEIYYTTDSNELTKYVPDEN